MCHTICHTRCVALFAGKHSTTFRLRWQRSSSSSDSINNKQHAFLARRTFFGHPRRSPNGVLHSPVHHHLDSRPPSHLPSSRDQPASRCMERRHLVRYRALRVAMTLVTLNHSIFHYMYWSFTRPRLLWHVPMMITIKYSLRPNFRALQLWPTSAESIRDTCTDLLC